MNVLIVSNRADTTAVLKQAFTAGEHHATATAAENARVLAAKSDDCDVIVLDGNGLDVAALCSAYAEVGHGVPLLALSPASVAGRIEVLDAGADDVLAEPYDVHEVLARARALVRRTTGVLDTLHRGPLTVNQRTQIAWLNDEALELNTREFAILTLLARRSGQLVTRAEILAQVWKRTTAPTSNLIDVYIRHLRTKLGDLAGALQTVRGYGYLLRLGDSSEGQRGKD